LDPKIHQCAIAGRTRAVTAIAGVIPVRGASTATSHTAQSLLLITSQTPNNEMEYLIVSSVAAMMIAYVWVIGRFLQDA
jgi:hypothetical protein